MQDLKPFIRERKPDISSNSVKTYASNLGSAYRRVFPNDRGIFHLHKFDEAALFLESLEGIKSRGAILAALFGVTKNPLYRSPMMEDIKATKAKVDQQVMTPYQEENSVTASEVETIWKNLEHRANLLYKMKTPTEKEFQSIQNFVILSVMSGVNGFCFPRRSLDYTAFKIRNVDRAKDNFMDKNTFVFRKYKTAQFHPEPQQIKIAPALRKIIVKWMDIQHSDFLFTNRNGRPLSSVTVCQRLNAMFGGKKISVNALRHCYLSTDFEETIAENRRLEETMQGMGSSSKVAHSYIQQTAAQASAASSKAGGGGASAAGGGGASAGGGGAGGGGGRGRKRKIDS